MVLSLKLLIVMGISWIFEFVHFLIADHIYNLDCYLIWQIVVGLFDFLNMHRGSLFFLIFVCKKSILSQLREKVFGRGGGEGEAAQLEMTRNPTLEETCRQVSTASKRTMSE